MEDDIERIIRVIRERINGDKRVPHGKIKIDLNDNTDHTDIVIEHRIRIPKKPNKQHLPNKNKETRHG